MGKIDSLRSIIFVNSPNLCKPIISRWNEPMSLTFNSNAIATIQSVKQFDGKPELLV